VIHRTTRPIYPPSGGAAPAQSPKYGSTSPPPHDRARAEPTAHSDTCGHAEPITAEIVWWRDYSPPGSTAFERAAAHAPDGAA
jgi:hypothetical protein